MRSYLKLLLVGAGLLLGAAAFAINRAISYVDLTRDTKNVTYFSKKKNKTILIREAEDKPKKRLMMHQTDGNQNPSMAAWKVCKSQLGVPGQGKLILIHPVFSDVVGTYSDTTSVEVAGKFPAGLKSGRWAKLSASFDATHRDKLTEDQKQGIRDAIDLFIEENRKRGIKASELQLVAHEQTYADRVFDPGLEIWQFAARYAKSRGMVVDELWHIDSGAPIHPEWRVT